MLQQDIDVFKMISEHFLQDVREFWTRSNFYLLADSALVSVYVSQRQAATHHWLGSFGIVVSGFWFVVARGSIYWIKAWRAEVVKLDEVVNRFRSFSAVEHFAKEEPWKSPSWVTQWLPSAFLLGWMVLLIAT